LAAELATHAVVLKKGRVEYAGKVDTADDVHSLFGEHVA
jgi:ABC-type branched-subunit amino acid transport system ATPase component